MAKKKTSSRKIALKTNVFEESLHRMRWIFDEFDNVVVSVSGGKDSTVVLELALMVAKERGRLPLKVLFLDQEAEFLTVIEHIRDIMARPEIEPMWMQIPFQIFNATSTIDHWLWTWDKEKESEWIRPKEPIAITENTFEETRFNELFTAMFRKMYPDEKACYIGGVRTEESPMRAMSLTQSETYKGRTWGKKLDAKRGHYTFYPIYDWSYTDVWKAIYENKWDYCKIYDLMYQYGVPLNRMRVSNLHHETAVHSMFILQELEPENYARVVNRLKGLDMAGKMRDNYFCPDKLPAVFSSWKEYRDYLLVNLLPEDWHEKFKKAFQTSDDLLYWIHGDALHQKQISSILTNDHEFVKLNALYTSIPKDKYDEYLQRRGEYQARKRDEKAARRVRPEPSVNSDKEGSKQSESSL